MPDTQAELGYGAKFGIMDAPGVYNWVAEVTSLTPPGRTRDTVEATHLESPDMWKEYIAGLKDQGEASLTLNFKPSDEDALADAFDAGKISARIQFPSGDVALDFSAIVTGYEIGDLVADDKMSATFTVKASGKPSMVALGSPANVILPAVVGVAQVGVDLSANPGNWNGAAVLAYQWLNAGVAIVGATDATYTPVAADVGDSLSVRVTATNATGTLSVTSGGTAPVLAV